MDFDQVDTYDFELPPQLIAQRPVKPRDASRLMLVDRSSGAISHHQFRDLAQLLRAGDRIIVNNTRVLAARLVGKRPTGGEVLDQPFWWTSIG
jgi:S-adenosylmethionine:tRNA ribosyltransferase-isomerase